VKLFPLDLKKVIDLACQLQQIPSPTFGEQQRADLLSGSFQSAGLTDIFRDEVGNVQGMFPGGDQRPLVVSAHLDSVHPAGTPLSIERTTDRVTGPGVADNCLGLASLVALANWLRAENVQLPGPVWFVGNVCEEGLGNLRGMTSIVDRFQNNAIAYLVLEGLGLGQVFHRGLCISRFRIKFSTPGGHSWVDYGNPSAVHELAEFITTISHLPISARPKTTLNFGVISGGNSINSVASRAEAELDVRSEDANQLELLVEQIQKIAVAFDREQVKIAMVPIGSRPAGSLAPDHPLVLLAQRCLEEFAIQPELSIASTDANQPLSRGYPAICMGLSTGGKAHTQQEYFNIQPLYSGLGCIFELITKVWSTT
jgi:tripeptide aminopeptidase